MAQSNLGYERIYVSLKVSSHTPSLTEDRKGQELMQRPWSSDCSACFLRAPGPLLQE